ncbi:hypothetical protein B566_EDAN013756 [Ephemera danica]|nr:hypothetical protein B566_EDAN013756 [Ephemera danica]
MNPKRKLSSNYVDRVRLQQKLKNTGQISPLEYSNGLYLLYVRDGGLIMISKRMNDLIYADFKGLSELYPDVQKQAMYLGVDESISCRFAVEFPSLSDEQRNLIEKKFDGCFVNLRQSLFLIHAHQSAIVSQGKSLLRWRRKRNFCPECGKELRAAAGWSHKVCSSCRTPQYPQMSPVSIALVEDQSHEQALLVRQPRHPPGMFSCLAGFIDMGESVEQSVEREVGEEVGLECSEVHYLCSQHWPYPDPRLMIGCVATAKPGEVDIDKEELEAAKWFSPGQLHAAIKQAASKRLPSSDQLWLPPPGALAHSLITWWLNQYHPRF